MQAVDCTREDEVVRLVLSRRWPHACDPELREHAESCEICSDVLVVARMLREDYMAGSQDARVPAAGQVWWRAAIRARMEAAHTVGRPITWMQGLAGACAVGIACATVGLLAPSLSAVVLWIAGHMSQYGSGLAVQASGVATFVMPFVLRSLPVLAAFGLFLVLAPIAFLLVFSED